MNWICHFPTNRSGRSVALAIACTMGLAGIASVSAQLPPAGRPSTPADTAPMRPPPVVPIPPPSTIPTDAVRQDGVGEAELEDARLALAPRMAQAAAEIVQEKRAGRDVAAWQQAIAYLEAARRLNPAEPRYPKLQSDAYAMLGDNDAAATALEAYLKLQGEDDTARLRLIEYYVARMQTTDAKLRYFATLLEKPSISNELKSRCATFAAVLLGERSAREQGEMTERAIALDPLNIYARRLAHAQLLSSPDATPVDRLRSLFAQLRCNPAQIHILEGIGRELAAAGLTREALDWMATAKNLSMMTENPDTDFLVEYCAQLYINGLTKEAEDGLSLLLTADPRNIPAWFLQLTLRRAAGLQVALDQDLERAKLVLESRVGAISSMLRKTTATTQPAAPDFTGAFAPSIRTAGAATDDGTIDPVPNAQRLSEMIAQLKTPEASPQIKAAFISVLSDLAWFEVYYNRSATASRVWIDALAQMLPENDITLVRLRGWFDILENRQAEAMKTLWSIRDRDVLAAMGVSRLLGQGNWTSGGAAPASRPASQDPIKTAQVLLNSNPTGLLGAILTAEFKDRKLSIEPSSYGGEMRTVAGAFPKDLMQMIVQGERFYVLAGEATRIPFRLGEPVLANVTLHNRTDYDLPIGVDGVIKPDLFFDARVSLGQERLFPMSGYDKISGPLVLKGRSSTSQVVRVDQGEITKALRERPAASVSINVNVMTNPVVRSDYRIVPGACGVRRQFSRPLIRGGMPIFNEVQKKKILDGLQGLPNERMAMIDLMAATIAQSRGYDADDHSRRAAPEFLDQIKAMQNDRVVQVADYATYMLARLSDGEQAAQRLALLEKLAKSQAWEGRLAAVWAARELPAADRKRVVGMLQDDADPVVRQVAISDLKLADYASTQPATQPATSPSSKPSDGPALPPVEGPAIPLPGQ